MGLRDSVQRLKTAEPPAVGAAIACLVMAASGFAGLGYQVVWTQQSALWLGHETPAVLAVVAAFFGGIAVGAWALGERIERSGRPLRWYVACEAVMAFWGAVLLAVSPSFSGWAVTLMGEQPAPVWQWAVAFGATFLLLLPATAAMGATLPAVERVLAPLQAGQRSIAALYASNTFGAVLGVLATAFWLVPSFGLARTASVCIALNLACAIAAGGWLTRPGNTATATPTTGRSGSDTARRGVLLRLAATGLLGIGYEVVVVRVIAQVAEDTVYTFAWLLAVYLVGSACGAAAYARWVTGRPATPRLHDRLQVALAAACIASSAGLWGADAVLDRCQAAFGSGMAARLAGEATLALAAFALPTVAMGALFSHLARLANVEGVSFGRALGFNTLGAAAAPLLFGVLLAPLAGAKTALLVIACGYLALTTRATRFTLLVLAPAGLALGLAGWAPRLAFIDVPAGGHIVYYEEGAMAAVSVVEDSAGVTRLRINNRQQEGSNATRFVDARQALLPLLLHPAPERALFLGLGTGVTASAAAAEAGLQVTAVELLPEVIAAARYFTAQNSTPQQLQMIAADARRYVRVAQQHYDVIVADNFHPARSGSGALYTQEHFAAVQQRLAPHGVFCQWLPLHQLDVPTLRSIVRSFLAVYPDGWALLANNSLQTPVLGLLARADGKRFDITAVQQRLARRALPPHGDSLGLDDELAVLGSFIAGPQALARFAGHAPLNTDDRPVVAYLAPRITYAPDSSPADRLTAVLGELSLTPSELVMANPDAGWTRRLTAYGTARNRFIEAGRGVTPSSDVHTLLAQVREPLLSVLRISPDFKPAYDPLLRMAAALEASDPAAAQALRNELAQTQPSALRLPFAAAAPRH